MENTKLDSIISKLDIELNKKSNGVYEFDNINLYVDLTDCNIDEMSVLKTIVKGLIRHIEQLESEANETKYGF